MFGQEKRGHWRNPTEHRNYLFLNSVLIVVSIIYLPIFPSKTFVSHYLTLDLCFSVMNKGLFSLCVFCIEYMGLFISRLDQCRASYMFMK